MEQKKLKDNNIFRYTIIGISIFIIILFRIIPAPNGLTQSAMAVIGTFIGVLILWLTISIDWPSILCILALGTIEGLNFKSLFMSSFGSDTFVFLLCTFICTYALSKTNIIKKVALWFISNKLAKKGPWFFSSMFFFSVIFLGMFISPSVLFVMLLPILEEIYKVANIEKGTKLSSMLMMGMAFCVSISSGMTPIAHVFPIISLSAYEQATGVAINYGQYMAVGIPVGILLTILMIVMFKLILKPDMTQLKNIDVTEMKNNIEKTTSKDIIILCVFIFVVLLWVLPSIFQNVFPEFYNLINGYTTAFPAMIGVVILCIIKIDNKPLVSIKEACEKGVPFSSLIMCAGTLCLGSAMTSDAIGLKAFLVNNLSISLANLAPYVLLLIFTIWTIIQTNVSSNMVTATVVSMVAVQIFSAILGGAIFPLSIVVIGMLSSFAFATPPSMPHIAIASGSEWSNTKHVALYGTILAIMSILLTISVGYFIGILIF